MKKTQLKDTLKTILHNKVSYISILIIALLAVSSYLGINLAAQALRQNADRFYSSNNFRDFELTSTMLLTEEDLENIRNTEGIADAEGIRFVNGYISKRDTRINMSVLSLPERINTLYLKEGELPSSGSTCVVEADLMGNAHLSIGDLITITNEDGSCPKYMKANTFKIVGTVLSPDHYAVRGQVPGNRYVYVQDSVFDREALSGNYMKAEIIVEKPAGISYFSSEYQNAVEQVRENLTPLISERAAAREQDVYNEYEEEIQKAENELADGKTKLDDARTELDEKTQELKDAEKDLEAAKIELDSAKQRLQKLEREISENEQKLADAKKELDTAEEKRASGEAELASAKAQLDEGQAQIDSARAQLDEAAAQVAAGHQQLVDGYNAAEDQKTLLREKIKNMMRQVYTDEIIGAIPWSSPQYVSDVNDPNMTLSTFCVTDALTLNLYDDYDSLVSQILIGLSPTPLDEETLAAKMAIVRATGDYAEGQALYDQNSGTIVQWDEAHAQYISGRASYLERENQYQAGLAEFNSKMEQYQAGVAEYESGAAQLEEKKAEYEDAAAKLEEAKQTLEDGKKQYEEKTQEYNDGIEKLEEGRESLKEGEQEYADGTAEYEESRQQLDDAIANEDDLGSCYWILMDAECNGGYVHARDSADNVGKLGITFAMLFIILGALVIYATVGRIVREDRRLIGAQKALGFFSREIIVKYLIFGVTATIIGILLGSMASYALVQKIVVKAHERFYVTDGIPSVFNIRLEIIVLLAGIAIAVLAVVWACTHLLREHASQLMEDETPKQGVFAKKGEKTNRSLYSRLLFRNMITELPRVLITTISIAGSCILLVIGFTIRENVSETLSRQFSEIYQYEKSISYHDKGNTSDEMHRVIEEYDGQGYDILTFSTVFSLNSKYVGFNLICGTPEDLTACINMRDFSTGETISMPEKGVVIQDRLAETYGLSKGDVITIYDNKMNPYTVEISGIYDNYLGRDILISKEFYEELLGEEVNMNTIWVKGIKDNTDFDAAIENINGFEKISSQDDLQTKYGSIVLVLNVITMLLILSAGMMAFFILLNLISMHLLTKKRELTVMRVNGFTIKETIRYFGLESFITTALGIVIGLAAGSVLGYFILRFLEQSHVGFVLEPNMTAWLFSILITIVFSALINSIAVRKIRKLKLTDINS